MTDHDKLKALVREYMTVLGAEVAAQQLYQEAQKNRQDIEWAARFFENAVLRASKVEAQLRKAAAE